MTRPQVPDDLQHLVHEQVTIIPAATPIEDVDGDDDDITVRLTPWVCILMKNSASNHLLFGIFTQI